MVTKDQRLLRHIITYSRRVRSLLCGENNAIHLGCRVVSKKRPKDTQNVPALPDPLWELDLGCRYSVYLFENNRYLDAVTSKMRRNAKQLLVRSK